MKDFEIDTISLSTGRLSTVYLWGGVKYATTLQYAITASLLFMKYIFSLSILTSGCKCSFSILFFHFTFFVSLISSVMSIYIELLYVGFKGLINVHIWRLE